MLAKQQGKQMTRGLAMACAFVATIGAVSSFAEADDTKVNLPIHLIVGPPAGPHPMARVNGSRTGLVAQLPSSPKLLWHQRVRGGTTLPVAVDETGAMVIASAVAELVQLDRNGREQWRQKLGMSVASTEPVITSNGTRVVLTSLGRAWGFGPDGTMRFQTDLSGFGAIAPTHPLPKEDGTVVVAVGSQLIVLDRDGSVGQRADVGHRLVGSIVSDGRSVLVTTDGGDVMRWSFSLPPHRIGTFRGSVREGFVRSSKGELLAVVDGQRLVAMDPTTGVAVTRWFVVGLEGPPTVGESGTVHVASHAGIVYSSESTTLDREVALDTSPDVSEGDGGVIPSYGLPSPPLLADRSGQVAFVRADGRVGVISTNGTVRFASRSSLATPVDLAAAGPNRFVVVCRTGDIFLYGP